MTPTEIANKALVKIGGAGDQINGKGFLESIDDDDLVSSHCRVLYEQCRKQVIVDLATVQCPFPETIKYADLGAEVDEERAGWQYAFNLPNDCLAIVKQLYEAELDLEWEFKFEICINEAGNAKLFLTNYYSNADNDSTYIQYVIDQTNTGMFSIPLIDCIATLMAAELCPILGKDIKTRQQMLLEYKTIVIPQAKSYNQSQRKNFTRPKTDWFGGRTGRQNTQTIYG